MKQFTVTERKYNNIERYLISYKLEELTNKILTDEEIGTRINNVVYFKITGIYKYKEVTDKGKVITSYFIKSEGFNILVNRTSTKSIEKLYDSAGTTEYINDGILYCSIENIDRNGKTHYKLKYDIIEV